MANCLVTRLKGVVENDNLPYLYGIKVEFITGGNFSASGRIKAIQGTFNVVEKGGSTLNNQTEAVGFNCISVKKGVIILVERGGFIASMHDEDIKLEYYSGSNVELKLSDLKGYTEYIGVAGILTGDVSIEDLSAKKIKVYIREDSNQKPSGQINIEGNTSATYIDIEPKDENGDVTWNGKTVIGNIEKLIPPIDITFLGCLDGVTGDVKVFAENLFKRGRKSGYLRISNSNTKGVNTDLKWGGKAYLVDNIWYALAIKFTNEGVELIKQSEIPA